MKGVDKLIASVEPKNMNITVSMIWELARQLSKKSSQSMNSHLQISEDGEVLYREEVKIRTLRNGYI